MISETTIAPTTIAANMLPRHSSDIPRLCSVEPDF